MILLSFEYCAYSSYIIIMRNFKCRLKIFVPITVLAFAVLVPVNWTGESLDKIKDLTYSDIDKLSISNVAPGSLR